MKAWVTRLWEGGAQIPRWRYSGLRPVLGELCLMPFHSDQMRRHLHVAHIFSIGHGKADVDLLPPLIDAAVVHMKGDFMTISGLESEMGKTCAQTWTVVMYREGEPNRDTA